jgi:hypothetical protein
MKAILICPNQANSNFGILADSRPLVTIPFLGESFICHWLQYLAAERFKEVRIVTTDPVSSISAVTGSGSRWGLKVEIFHEIRELSPAEARKRYRPSYEADWPAEPNDVIVANHFPGVAGHNIFESYASWFKGLGLWLPQLIAIRRVGTREIEPGVWVGRRCKIAKTARLIAPCWLGHSVHLGASAVVGPMTFLEDQVVVEKQATISNSWVGPDTFIGTLTELKDSLAWGALLVNWKTGSHTIIPDPFLMTSLAQRPREKRREGKLAKFSHQAFVRPFEAVISFAQKLQG